MGYELWGVEYRNGLLVVYIDGDNGIGVDDCAKVSYQISGLLDVEDPIKENYELEVSSPGMDRPLFTLEQCSQFVGEQVKVKLVPGTIEGRRNFTGVLKEVLEDEIVVEMDGENWYLPFTAVEQARLHLNYKMHK